jgi:hypothetical protein
MLVTLEFADAGTKSGTHSVLVIGRYRQSAGGRYAAFARRETEDVAGKDDWIDPGEGGGRIKKGPKPGA